MNFKEGEILLIDKPLEWTSFDVVKKIRNMICKHLNVKKIKVGHAGTLDPLASGLMVICTGKKTKELQFLQNDSKEYITTVKFGGTTVTGDLECEVDKEYEYTHITRELIEDTIQKKFSGTILQTPPIFSAKKVDGKASYKRARSGEDFELKPVEITIQEIEILNFELPEVELRIKCSKGTYIRSLAMDLGKALNSGAHLTSLRRISSGEFNIENSMTLKEFQNILFPES